LRTTKANRTKLIFANDTDYCIWQLQNINMEGTSFAANAMLLILFINKNEVTVEWI
jgi:hypothetical protein